MFYNYEILDEFIKLDVDVNLVIKSYIEIFLMLVVKNYINKKIKNE